MENLYRDKTMIGEKRSSHIHGINGLKGIAIIGVTLFHMFPETVRGGYLGVVLFFLLTGYLLAYSDVVNKRQYSITEYIKKRLKRIYPPLLMVLLLTLGVYYFILPNTLSGIRWELLSIVLGYNNWWQIAQNADYFTRLANTSPFTHLWFLGIELQYFVIWPILFYIFKKLRIYGFWLIFLLGAASAVWMTYLYVPGQDVTRLYYGTDTRAYALIFGAVLGILMGGHTKKSVGVAEPNPLWKRIAAITAFTILLIGLLIGYVFLGGQNPLLYQGGMAVITIGLCAMIGLVNYESLTLGKWLDNPVLKWLGKKSYGIFLWQYPVLYAVHRLNLINQAEEPLLYGIAVTAVILVLTVWTDYMVSFIERLPEFMHILRFGKRVAIVAMAIVTCCVMALGVYGVAVSSSEKMGDLQTLHNRLAANEAKQQQENEKAAQLRAEKQAQVKQSLAHVSAIGDSVMLGASDSLRKELPGIYIDAKVSRYVGAGEGIAKKMQSEDRLGNVVLIGLGTNGPISGYYESDTKALLKYLGDKRQIFWVNVYCPGLEWQNSNNKYLEQLAKEHKNIKIIDWYSLISKHPEWLAEDGIHPNDEGVKAYAQLVRTSMEKDLEEDEK